MRVLDEVDSEMVLVMRVVEDAEAFGAEAAADPEVEGILDHACLVGTEGFLRERLVSLLKSRRNIVEEMKLPPVPH